MGLQKVFFALSILTSVGVLISTWIGAGIVPFLMYVAGIFISNSLGVATSAYLPFAVMCYTSVFFSIFYGITGIAVKKTAVI
ncbi:MAG: hypothetical protein ACOY9Y_11545 [Bacillota bacterium]